MKRYVLPELPPQEACAELEVYPPLLGRLLLRRGLVTERAAENFLNPDYEAHFHDPFLMKDMERSVGRVLEAIRKKESVIIYSDYDCDGTPGGALLLDFFKKVGHEPVANYIPHRHEEGYGLNAAAVERFAAQGAKLIITVDCGITDVAPAARAKALGVDLIITDHHLPAETLPDAYAILNPKQSGDSYPNPMLCGSGVAFKLVQALLARGAFDVPAGWEKWLLDLAGLATIADMVPLTGENRALAYFGLKVLRKSPRPGLQQLCRKMRVDQRHLSEDDVGFMIAPRINVASRLDDPLRAFQLLSTDDEKEAETLAGHLHKLNDARKGLVASMAREIKRRLAELGEPREIIVMGDTRWRPALLGLAANTLVEEYRRPVFLWGREGRDVLKGSCRSDGSVNVVELMSLSEDLFIERGGHAQAGGFALIQERLHLLESRLIASYQTLRREVRSHPAYLVDEELSLDDVTWENHRLIERLAPFGEGNPKPLFAFPNVRVGSVRRFGREGAHVELKFGRPSGGTVTAVEFFAKPERYERLAPASPTTLIASFENSRFAGTSSLRLRITDIF